MEVRCKGQLRRRPSSSSAGAIRHPPAPQGGGAADPRNSSAPDGAHCVCPAGLTSKAPNTPAALFEKVQWRTARVLILGIGHTARTGIRCMTLEERFWNKVARSAPDACWVWRGKRNRAGYGRITDGGRLMLAHRVSWALAYGSYPDAKKMVCHSCDVPACVNPSHLFVGSGSDNQVDVMRKSRRPSRLTIADVREVRRLIAAGVADRDIAQRFAVSKPRVVKIRTGRQWRWLE